MTTQPLTFARAVNCPDGLPVERVRTCAFMRDPDVARFVARLRADGFAVVIAPDGWRPPSPPECPSGYLLTLLCPAAEDYRRVVRLREAEPHRTPCDDGKHDQCGGCDCPHHTMGWMTQVGQYLHDTEGGQR